MVPPPPPPQAGSRVARPAARYRPGKAPVSAGATLDEYSDSDASDGGHAQDTKYEGTSQEGITDLSFGASAFTSAAGQQRRTAGIIVKDAIGLSSKTLDLRLRSTSTTAAAGEEENSSEYETDTDQEEAAAKPVFRKPEAAASAQQQTAQASDSSEYETDSEGESEESETKTEPLLKPIFVPKRARTTISTDAAADQHQLELDAEAKAEAEAAVRRKEAHDLAAAAIKRQLAEQEYQDTHQTDVDDTDGLDPEAEFQAWRERELARLRRDHEAILAKQRAQQEIDAFKSLPEAEKERLGRERAAQLRAEKKEQRGNPAFLQKYYHKGSFFQDMDILKRDYTEKTSKDVDISKLPKMMQVRGYGEKGRSKWTHLANEDTSKGAMRLDVLQGGSKGCFRCGGPHLRKDCPEAGGKAEGGSGANSSKVVSEASRNWGDKQANDDVNDYDQKDMRRGTSRSPHQQGSRRHDQDTSGPSSHNSQHRYDDDDDDDNARSKSKGSRSHSNYRGEQQDRKHPPSLSSSSRRDGGSSRSHHHNRQDRKDDGLRHHRERRPDRDRDHDDRHRSRDQDRDRNRDRDRDRDADRHRDRGHRSRSDWPRSNDKHRDRDHHHDKKHSSNNPDRESDRKRSRTET